MAAPAYVGTMEPPPRTFAATVSTAAGSRVTFGNLTQDQANAIVDRFAQDAPEEPAPLPAAAETEQCSNCQGAGGWEEIREQETASGGTVSFKVWVTCRPCRGTGQVAKR